MIKDVRDEVEDLKYFPEHTNESFDIEEEVSDVTVYEPSDVDSYEKHKSETIINIQESAEKVLEAIDVASNIAKDSNNVNALGKMAELARVYLDSQKTIYDIVKTDVEMKNKKIEAALKNGVAPEGETIEYRQMKTPAELLVEMREKKNASK